MTILTIEINIFFVNLNLILQTSIMRTKQEITPRVTYSCPVQLEPKETNQNNVKNPWFVNNLEEFLYFCCPECDGRNQSKELFLKHALDQHPNSKVYLSNILVKQENNEKINLNNEDYTSEYFKYNPSELSYMKTDYDISDIVKCEVIEELDNEISKNNFNTIEDQPNVVSNLKNADPLNVDEGIKNHHKCDICSKSFNNKNNLKRHIINAHNELTHQCEFCEQRYYKPSDLRKHTKRVHEQIRNHKCDTCTKAFTSKKDLMVHIDSVHKGLKHTCELCGNDFSGFASLINHFKNVHNGEKSHKCELCDKAYYLDENLKKHIAKVHTKHKCDLCENSYQQMSRLREHIKRIHEKLREHKCDICSKAFHTRTGLKKHSDTVHKGLKNYKCEFCGKSFKASGHLNIHIKKVHEGAEGNHTCELCGKAFFKGHELKRHIAYVLSLIHI